MREREGERGMEREGGRERERQEEVVVLGGGRERGEGVASAELPYRGTSLIRKRTPLRPYRGPMPQV